jgi:D-alanyl-D-alanine carboxypeptidase (penicillin-binding protein 5/6)
MTNRRTFLRTSLLGFAAAVPGSLWGQYRLPAPPHIDSKACIVVDAVNGQVLFEKAADERRPVASTQKLLSALVAVETLDMKKTITVTAADTKCEPTKLYLKAGEQLPLGTVLTGMLIKSYNDAAQCVARCAGGSVPGFATLMNRRAAQLGMRNSHFKNPHGLPADGQFSTARDMSKLARVVLFNPTIRNIVSRYEVTIKRGDGRTRKIQNTNFLLKPDSSYYLPQCTGMKTGFTNAAGKCLISSATLRGRSVICVLLGAWEKGGEKSSIMAWRESKALLQWALGITG